MELSTRLSSIAKFVPLGSKVVDVGTDHGYIPIYLRQNNKCKLCIASDINKGPLEKAKTHIAKYNVTGIELRQASGLLGVQPGEIDTVIIAGMGGFLIIDILKNAEQIVKGVTKLILQPQTEVGAVRKCIHSLGFKIEEEVFIKEDGKYYIILSCSPGDEIYQHEYEYQYGKDLIQKSTPLFREWMENKKFTFEKIYNHLTLSHGSHVDKRKEKLDEERAMYEEVMKCLQ